MIGNASKSRGFGEIGPQGPPGPQGIQGEIGKTPSVSFEYDEETGDLYYESDGILEETEYVSSLKTAPYIGENGNWYTFDAETGTHIDSGVVANGESDAFFVHVSTNGYYVNCNSTNAKIIDAIKAGKEIKGTFSNGLNTCKMVSYNVDSKYVDTSEGDVSVSFLTEYVKLVFFDGVTVTEISYDPQTEQWCMNGSQVPTPEEVVDEVLASLPDADTMSFPLEETTSEVSEE